MCDEGHPAAVIMTEDLVTKMIAAAVAAGLAGAAAVQPLQETAPVSDVKKQGPKGLPPNDWNKLTHYALISLKADALDKGRNNSLGFTDAEVTREIKVKFQPKWPGSGDPINETDITRAISPHLAKTKEPAEQDHVVEWRKVPNLQTQQFFLPDLPTVVETQIKVVCFEDSSSKLTFDDFKGTTSLINRLTNDFVGYIKHHDALIYREVQPPSYIMLHGPPGTGKSRLALTLVQECGANHIVLTTKDFASTDLASRIGRFFEIAAEKPTCFLIFEECEAILSKENLASTTQFLNEWNALERKEKKEVFLVALTNNPKLLPDSLKDRFRFAYVGLPDAEARTELIEDKLATIRHELSQEDIKKLVAATVRFSGRQLHALINEAKNINRNKALNEAKTRKEDPTKLDPSQLLITMEDVDGALLHIRGLDEETNKSYEEAMSNINKYA